MRRTTAQQQNPPLPRTSSLVRDKLQQAQHHAGATSSSTSKPKSQTQTQTQAQTQTQQQKSDTATVVATATPAQRAALDTVVDKAASRLKGSSSSASSSSSSWTDAITTASDISKSLLDSSVATTDPHQLIRSLLTRSSGKDAASAAASASLPSSSANLEIPAVTSGSVSAAIVESASTSSTATSSTLASSQRRLSGSGARAAASASSSKAPPPLPPPTPPPPPSSAAASYWEVEAATASSPPSDTAAVILHGKQLASTQFKKKCHVSVTAGERVSALALDSKKVDVPAAPESDAAKKEREANPWKKDSSGTAAAGGAGAGGQFKMQANGWSSAQLCGRTSALSVTCMVRRADNNKSSNSGGGSELRHVAGAITSIGLSAMTATPTTTSESVDDATSPQVCYSLTSTAAPVQVSWPVPKDDLALDDDEGGSDSDSDAKKKQLFPSLVPHGDHCRVVVTQKGDNSAAAASCSSPPASPTSAPSSPTGGAAAAAARTGLYEGPMQHGVRHGGSDTAAHSTKSAKSPRKSSSPAKSSSTKSPLDQQQQQQIATLTINNNTSESKATTTSNSKTSAPSSSSDSDFDADVDADCSSRNNKNAAFRRIQYSGQWERDVFSGNGAVEVSFRGATSNDDSNSNALCITAADWNSLGEIASSSDATVRFGAAASDPTPATLLFRSSPPYLTLTCVGKMLAPPPAAAAATAKKTDDSKEKENTISNSLSSSSYTAASAAAASAAVAPPPATCHHIFKCAAAPVLRVLPKDGVNLCDTTQQRMSVLTSKSSSNNNNNAHAPPAPPAPPAPAATLGSFLNRSNTPTLPTSVNAASVAAVPRLFVSLACSDLLQMLYFRASSSENASSSKSGGGGGGGGVEAAQSVEARLALTAAQWNLFSAVARSVRDQFVEPQHADEAQMQTALAAARQKLERARRAHAELKQLVESAAKEVGGGADGNDDADGAADASNSSNNNNNKNDDTDSLEQLEERIAQLQLDRDATRVDAAAQREHLLQLREDTRQSDARLRQLNADVDALQRECDHCAESRRSLQTKKGSAIAQKQDLDATYLAARRKLAGLMSEQHALEREYFVAVMEPTERRKTLVSLFAAEDGGSPTSPSASSSSSSSSSSSFAASLTKSLELATSDAEKERGAAVDAQHKAKSKVGLLEDERERLQKAARDMPDESALLVAFQSAEAQSEIVLSRIRALQADASDGAATGADAILQEGEAGVRTRHAQTMSTFSKRLADIRESIRSATNVEAALVAEIETLQVAPAMPTPTKPPTTTKSKDNKQKPRRHSTEAVAEEFFDDEAAADRLFDEQSAQLRSLQSEAQSVATETRELQHALLGPSLLLLDSSQLAALSNDLLRSLLAEAKRRPSFDAAAAAAAASPPPSTAAQMAPASSGMFSASSSSSFAGGSPVSQQQPCPWTIDSAMQNFDSKSRALQFAIAHCDAATAELRSKAQRVKQLESKLEVAMEAASSASASAEVQTRMQMQQQQQQQHRSSLNNHNNNTSASPSSFNKVSSVRNLAPLSAGGTSSSALPSLSQRRR